METKINCILKYDCNKQTKKKEKHIRVNQSSSYLDVPTQNYAKPNIPLQIPCFLGNVKVTISPSTVTIKFPY